MSGLGDPQPEVRYVVKDSGKRQEFDSGMTRDIEEGKLDWWRLFDGVMPRRLVEHLTKGAVKYPDVEPGVANWTQANSPEEVQRFRSSAARHFAQWMAGETDEDHAAGIIFNVNGAETTEEKLMEEMPEVDWQLAIADTDFDQEWDDGGQEWYFDYFSFVKRQ